MAVTQNTYIPGKYIQNLYDSIQNHMAEFESTQLKEWEEKVKPEVVYQYETISKTKRIAYNIFSTIIFPIGLVRLIHGIVGKCIFFGWITSPKSQREFFLIKGLRGKSVVRSLGWFGEEEDNDVIARNHQQLVAKRVHILVNGQRVDAFLYGRRETINNGNWTLVARGAGDCMELVQNYELKADNPLQSNYLFFNYTGVGAGEGFLPNKTQVVNTYKAMLRFLEDSQGVGARKITCWGRSIGAAVQGEGLKDHVLQDHIHYDFIKDRTFSLLSKVGWYTKPVKLFGWEFDNVASSKKLEEKGRREFIVQTSEHDTFANRDDVQDDGLISQPSSLAYALLSEQSTWNHKQFIGISSGFGHYGLSTTQQERIRNFLPA